MQGYRLENMHAGKYCYSVSRPPSGGEPCELPANVAECFERKERGDVKLADYDVRRDCPLHCVFTDEAGNIVEKSYLFA
jgi:hypothetical protein